MLFYREISVIVKIHITSVQKDEDDRLLSKQTETSIRHSHLTNFLSGSLVTNKF